MRWELRCTCQAASSRQRCKLRRVNNLPTCHVHAPTCPICLVSLSRGDDTARLACGHRYHTSCISYWMDHSDSCPQCRGKIRSCA